MRTFPVSPALGGGNFAEHLLNSISVFSSIPSSERESMGPFHFGIVDSRARVSATTRLVNFGSRTNVEPSIGWPPSS